MIVFALSTPFEEAGGTLSDCGAYISPKWPGMLMYISTRLPPSCYTGFIRAGSE